MKLLHSNSGSSAIEFGLISPILLYILFAAIECGLIFFAYCTMELAVSYTSRDIEKNGYHSTAVIRENIVKESSGLLKSENIDIQSRLATNYNAVIVGEPCLVGGAMVSSTSCPTGTPYLDTNKNGKFDGSASFALGGSGDLIEVRVTYPWRVITPFLGNVIGEQGVHNIRTKIIIKNEAI